MTNSKVNIPRDIAWKVRILLHDSKSAWLQRRWSLFGQNNRKPFHESPIIRRYGSLNRTYLRLNRMKIFPLGLLDSAFATRFRGNLVEFDVSEIFIKPPWRWIFSLDKEEEKEGTFRDNSGSLLVLLTSFHGQRDLENGRFIAVQRD